MKKILYLHGFLGQPQDMEPLFINGFECHSLNLKHFQDQPEDIFKHHQGSFDYAVAYSFGGRFLARLLGLKPSFVDKPVFCSSRLTPYSLDQLKERERFKKILIEKLDQSVEDFYKYWRSLSLFGGHNMNEFRDKNSIQYTKWTADEIHHFLSNHFTYEAIDLSPFKDRSYFLYGMLDGKYKAESNRLEMKSYGFKNLGHRFLFEDSIQFKKYIKDEILK